MRLRLILGKTVLLGEARELWARVLTLPVTHCVIQTSPLYFQSLIFLSVK